MKQLATELVQIGLSGLESQVYLGLLERHLTTAGVLAKHLNLKRSTVYTILDALIEKGLVSTTQVEAVKHFQAESPQRLKEFLEQRKRAIEEQQQGLKQMMNSLMKLHEQKVSSPRITLYEGKQGIDHLLMKNLDDQPSEVLVIGEYMADRDHIEPYTNRRIVEKIPTKVVVPPSPYGKACQKQDKKCYRKTYLTSKKYQFPASVHVYDGSVSLFTYSGNHPVGVYIEHPDIATTLRMIFKLVESTFKK